MELDDFKKKLKDRDTIKVGEQNDNINRFIENVKAEMKNQKKKSIFWISVLIMLSVIYISAGSRTDDISGQGFVLTVIGFVLGAVYLYLRYKPLSHASYSKPMVEFLENVEKRLVFMNTYDTMIVLVLLLILGTGGGIIFITRLMFYIDNFALLLVIWIVFFILLSGFGFYASKKNWERDHRKLFEHVKEVRKHLFEKDI